MLASRNRVDPLAQAVAECYADPLAFVYFNYPWGEPGPLEKETGPDDWQKVILNDLAAGSVDAKTAIQIAVASGHGIGKPALVSWIIGWFISTRPHPQIVVTANTSTQLQTKTWRELAKWHNLARNKDWFDWTFTKYAFKAYPETWFASAIPWSKERSEAFAGTHEENVLVIFDEASLIDDSIWAVTEGAMTQEGSFWLAFGNPTRNTGRFYDCFHKYRHRWKTFQIDSRTAKITNKDQIKQWVDDYGEDSDFCRVRIRGLFPMASDHQFIPLNYVEMARGKHLRPDQYTFAPKIITLDNAWTGGDEIVIGMRQGLAFSILATFQKNDDDMVIAGHLARLEDDKKADAVMIDFGYGTGVYSAGKQMGRDWILVQFGGASPDPGYLNLRAWMWAQTKQWLKDGGAIPDDQILCDDLIAPEAYVVATGPNGGKTFIESKKDLKARGLPSPNRADALCLSFAKPIIKRQREYRILKDQVRKDYNVLEYSA